MKKLLAIILCAAAVSQVWAQQNKRYDSSDFRNYFGLAWTSNPTEILKYCQNVGHKHVMFQPGMENTPLSDGITFYIETPEYGTYDRIIYLDKKYPEEKIREWESICTVAFPEKPFPENMATGWFFSKTKTCLPLDMQQKKVHERTIRKILENVKRITQKNPKFKFGGFTFDVPQPYGDFNAYRDNQWNNMQVTLKYWTGTDSTPEREGITHDYKTYFEGYFEFYRSLMRESRKLNPNAKLIVEPYDLYRDWVKYFDTDFMKAKGAAAKDYMADFVWCEGNGTKFLTDKKVYANGLLTKDLVGSSCPHTYLEKDAREVGAMSSVNGAWACFFGRYGGYDLTPWAASIRDIPAYVKLAKLIPVWENINNTPLEMRKYENGVYTSPTAYMSDKAYWAIQPERDRAIVVFNSDDGEITLPEEWQIVEVKYLDNLFSECGKVNKKVLTIAGNSMRPAAKALTNMAFSVKLKKK